MKYLPPIIAYVFLAACGLTQSPKKISVHLELRKTIQQVVKDMSSSKIQLLAPDLVSSKPLSSSSQRKEGKYIILSNVFNLPIGHESPAAVQIKFDGNSSELFSLGAHRNLKQSEWTEWTTTPDWIIGGSKDADDSSKEFYDFRYRITKL